jgi:hypothetical protein
VAIEDAVESVLDAGLRTRDLVGPSSVDQASIRVVNTEEMTDAVIGALDLPADWTEGAETREEQSEQLAKDAPTAVQEELQPLQPA